MAINYKSSDIKRIAGSKFSKGEIGGKKIGGIEAKKYVSDLVKKGSGRTLSQISEGLKKAGLRGGQENDRNRWLKAIEESKKKDKILIHKQIERDDSMQQPKERSAISILRNKFSSSVNNKNNVKDLGVNANKSTISITQNFNKAVNKNFPSSSKMGGVKSPIKLIV
ncbi:MAG: hypothetical protein AAB653_02425 [Patescibacteria group bacterium]